MAGLKGLADKAKQLVNRNPDKARKGIDRVSNFADQKTGGKYSDKINKGTERAKGYVEGQDQNQDQSQSKSEGGEGRQGRQG